MNTALIFAIVTSLIGIAFSVISIYWILRQPDGNARMQEIATAISVGATAYLKRQYMTIGMVGVILFVVIFFALGAITAFGFALGAVLSGAAGLSISNITCLAG